MLWAAATALYLVLGINLLGILDILVSFQCKRYLWAHLYSLLMGKSRYTLHGSFDTESVCVSGHGTRFIYILWLVSVLVSTVRVLFLG